MMLWVWYEFDGEIERWFYLQKNAWAGRWMSDMDGWMDGESTNKACNYTLIQININHNLYKNGFESEEK